MPSQCTYRTGKRLIEARAGPCSAATRSGVAASAEDQERQSRPAEAPREEAHDGDGEERAGHAGDAPQQAREHCLLEPDAAEANQAVGHLTSPFTRFDMTIVSAT